MQAPQSAYTQIKGNNIKTAFLMLAFPVMLCFLLFLACYLCTYFFKSDVDFTLGGIDQLAMFFPFVIDTIDAEKNAQFFAALGYTIMFVLPIFVISAIWLTFSFFFGDKMMMSFAEAKQLTEEDNKPLFRTVRNVATMAGLPMPKVFLIDDESLNAFATGYRPKNASVAVTKGLVEKLKPLELEAVVAHEMAHIGNRDIRLNMIIITGISVFAFLADAIGRSAFRRSRSRKSESQSQILFLLIYLALLTFNFIIAPLLQLAVSRTREFAADATAAKITHNPKALASALQKISQDARVEVLDQQPNMARACIASPLQTGRRFLSQLSATHPPIDVRIERLESM